MKSIVIIAFNTYREIIRDRILYGLIIFSLLLIGVSLALGQLSFSEQIRVSIDFGFTAIHIAAAILAIFLGSTLVGKEIDKKTILTLLARPITRLQFLLGKCSGLLLVILTLLFGLAVVMGSIVAALGMYPTVSFFVGLYGIFLEALLLLGITLFFSSFSRPVMVVVFSLGFFLIGHWIESLAYFTARAKSEWFVWLGKSIIAVFPNLEDFNWRSLFVYGDSINLTEVLVTTFYAFCWFGLAVTAAAMVIRRRDFV